MQLMFCLVELPFGWLGSDLVSAKIQPTVTDFAVLDIFSLMHQSLKWVGRFRGLFFTCPLQLQQLQLSQVLCSS